MRYLEAHEFGSVHDDLRQDGNFVQVTDEGIAIIPLEIMTEDMGSFVFFRKKPTYKSRFCNLNR